MTRMEALEAVAAAARSALHSAPSSYERLGNALAALDALPGKPQPQGETVTLAVWRNDKHGSVGLYQPGTRDDEPSPGWTRLGTVTLLLDRERGE